LPKETLPETLPKTDSLKKVRAEGGRGERKIEIPLPSDRDMDRMMLFSGARAWEAADREMANRLPEGLRRARI